MCTRGAKLGLLYYKNDEMTLIRGDIVPFKWLRTVEMFTFHYVLL